MKKVFGFALVAASLLLASGAQAQGLHVRANVPFDFAIGNNVYPAGSYEIERVLTTGNGLLITSDAKMSSTFALPHECSSGKPAEKTVLVFHRIGDEYFLYQIWTEGNFTGRELPQPKRETELARNGKADEVIVAANLIKK
jgi:hypothetical protein